MCHEQEVEDSFEEPSQLQEGRRALGLAAGSPWSPQSWHSRAHGYRTCGAALGRSEFILPQHAQLLVRDCQEVDGLCCQVVQLSACCILQTQVDEVTEILSLIKKE